MLLYQLFGHAILCVLVAARPWQYQGKSTCPTKILVNASGTITSPGYQDHYAANTKCSWIIVAPKKAFVALKFVSLETGPSCKLPGRCQCNYVEIREVKKRSRHKYTRKFCEEHYPKSIITTTSNEVRVHFKTNKINQGKGFVLKYWFENKPLKPMNVNQPGSAKLSTDRVTSYEQLSKKVRRSLEDGMNRIAPPSRKVRDAPRSNNSGEVVMYQEDKEKAKKEEQESEPPGVIVLGPAIPIILIFVGVVASIAWWQFRSDQKERLRYYKEQIRYEEISKRSKSHFKKKKQSLREIRMKKLYGDMARNWQGTQPYGGPRRSSSGQTKRSFAGRLLELAEKPVSYIRTPRGSRPSSMIQQEQGEPMVVMREKKDKPAGHRPPSRPASVLLRDALNMIFGATTASQDLASDPSKEPGSENDSKRASLKRVSFYDTVVDKMADVKENEDEESAAKKPAESPEKPAKPKPAPLLIPHIMVRQPSYEGGESKKTPEVSPSEDKPHKSPEPVDSKDGSSLDAVVEPEQSSTQQSAPPTEQEPLLDDKETDSQRPRSFEKKLVEMLEVLQNEKEEFPEDEKGTEQRDDLREPSPPPVPNQTPVPRDSGSSTSQTGKTNCADLEDFLLNLDKELEEDDEP